jgi:hypothetical protein
MHGKVLIWAAAAALGWSVPASAQSANQAAAQPPAPQLTNSVTCIYDAMSAEQREMVQALTFQLDTGGGDQGGGDPIAAAEGSAEVRALLTDASNACIDLYPWTSGKENNAVAYAIFTIVFDFIHPAMSEEGFDYADIDAYVETNRARLRASAPPSPAMLTAINTHLTGLGWNLAEAEQRDQVKDYFTMMLLREYMRQGFASGIFYRESSGWSRDSS